MIVMLWCELRLGGVVVCSEEMVCFELPRIPGELVLWSEVPSFDRESKGRHVGSVGQVV